MVDIVFFVPALRVAFVKDTLIAVVFTVPLWTFTLILFTAPPASWMVMLVFPVLLCAVNWIFPSFVYLVTLTIPVFPDITLDT